MEQVAVKGSVYVSENTYTTEDFSDMVYRLNKEAKESFVYCTKGMLKGVSKQLEEINTVKYKFSGQGLSSTDFICDMSIVVNGHTFHFICKGNIKEGLVIPVLDLVDDLAKECIILKYKKDE